MCSIHTIVMPVARSRSMVSSSSSASGVGESTADLVEEQDLRIGGQDTRKLESLAVEQSEGERAAIGDGQQTGQLQDGQAAVVGRGAPQAGTRGRADVHVLEDGHVREGSRHLVGAPDAHPAAVRDARGSDVRCRGTGSCRRWAVGRPTARRGGSSCRRRWARRCRPSYPLRPRTRRRRARAGGHTASGRSVRRGWAVARPVEAGRSPGGLARTDTARARPRWARSDPWHSRRSRSRPGSCPTSTPAIGHR